MSRENAWLEGEARSLGLQICASFLKKSGSQAGFCVLSRIWWIGRSDRQELLKRLWEGRGSTKTNHWPLFGALGCTVPGV